MRVHHFWAQNGPFAPNKKLLWKKIINIIFIYLLAPFVVQNLKNIFTADPELWGCVSFGPKIAHLPKWEFFRKPVNKPCSFHSSLSMCQKSKSDIHLLMKYWWLKNTEISLAENNFWLYFENQIFPKDEDFAEC